MVTPNYIGLDNPFRDIRSIPMEWLKPQGVAGNVNPGSHMLALLPETVTTAKVIRSSDSAALPVNLTILENAGNVDITKFHFEKCAMFSIGSLPLLRKFRVRTMTYIKNIAQYRYTDYLYTGKDGTLLNAPPYHQLLGINMNSNPYTSSGLYCFSDVVVDFTSQNVTYTTTNMHRGRRAGFASAQIDSVLETDYKLLNVSKEIAGVTTFRVNNQQYANVANGGIIEIYNIGELG